MPLSPDTTSLLFIDSRVPDIDSLVRAAQPGTRVVVLDSTQDGIAQIAAAVQGQALKGGVASIGIVSHGDSGVLLLGSTVLTAGNLGSYAAQLKAIGGAVAADGDIQLYGCDTGAGSTGLAFINLLAQATGSGVAASNNTTGGSAVGGDWNLEITSGNAHAATLLDTAALAGYDHTLKATSVGTYAALKDALDHVNDAVDDVIVLTGDITLAAGQTLAVSVTDGHTLTIVGGGHVLDGGNLVQVMTVNTSNLGSAVVLQDVVVQNGFLAGGGGGSNAFDGPGGSGAAALGAGIYNAGNLTLIGTTVTANKAAGGGGGGGNTGDGSSGGGGGGGGFGSTFGASGGGAGSGGVNPAGPASQGVGGSGGEISPGNRGMGGSTVGGAGGSPPDTAGGNGGSGAGGTGNLTTIGGGGGGSGYDRPGGAGGNAVAGIYNASGGTITIVGSSITGNVAAGGGGGGSGAAAGGMGGNAGGGLWNDGGTVRLDAGSSAAMALNGAGSGLGGKGSVAGTDGAASANTVGGPGPVVNNFVATTVTSVSATTLDGSYQAGATIAITVGFSAAVAVTGTPKLTLATGNTTTEDATYAGGTGTSSLTFNYVVQAGDTAADLDYSSVAALGRNGGTVDGGGGVAAILALAAPGAAGSLGASKNIVIGAAPPPPAPAPAPEPAPAPPPGVAATAPAGGGTVQGGAGNDTLTGQGGNDRFVLGGGTDTVNGGAGLNTVVEAGNRAQYTLNHAANGSFTVKGADGSVATLQNVQRISFGDVTIAIDPTTATGRVAEFYQTALGRRPEGDGLDYYLAQPGTASTLQKAQGFVASAEFAGRYGSLTDSAFITQMYTNAFGRAPDAGGMAFYLDALSHTTPLEGRAGLLAGFLDSAEMGVKLVGLVDQGVPLRAG